jgi:hypothetical protein
MRFAVVGLSLSVLVLAGPGCARRQHWPIVMSPVSLEQPYVWKQPNGTQVPCGRGIALVFGRLLWTCAIDRRATIQGHDLPAGATVCFRGDGTLEEVRYLEARATLVPGKECRVRRRMSFDPSGRLARVTMECDEEK